MGILIQMKVLNWLPLALLLAFLSACKPGEFKADLYTSDIEIARDGEVLDVPVSVSFSLLGNDDQGIFDRVVQIAKRSLSPDSTFSKSKAMMGERLVIDTKLPMGNKDSLKKYLDSNNRLAVFLVEEGKSSTSVSLVPTALVKTLSKQIQDINILLSLRLPPSKSLIRVSSDSRKPVEVSGIAVFVSKKPYLNYSKTLNRRDSVEIEFKGDSGSVYSEIYPILNIKN